MNLVGSKLGPYEIFAPLGAGGMGEVYRARDARLKREVAIKILPPELLENRERQQRFQQEAQAASSLNHPNILVVHDIGVENGTHYMVSELVDGESLGKMIQKGPIAIKKLLDIAVQIADGLAAAHQAGIVHRDLKPENIMITPENRVKILDFGLAKLAPIGIEEHETLSHALSRSGIIRGTVPYMSPEQASSKTVDFRSDQFSLGLILYEMATGKRAFQQDTPVQVLSAIISEEPPAISTLNPKVPAPLRWMIERCMTKEPRQRYDSTADLHRELRSLSDHLSETGTSVEVGMTVPLRRPRWKQLAIAMTLVAAMCGVFIALLLARSRSEDLSSYSVTPLVTGVHPFSRPGWSPDGKTIAYVDDVDQVNQVFTKDLESLVSTQITNAKQNCIWPLWSADGSRVYYVSGSDLWLVSAAGGPSEKILENVMAPVISYKANALAFLRRKAGHNTLWISSPPGAEPREYTLPSSNAKEIFDRSISFSPDGSEIALWARTAEDIDFWIIPYPSGKLRSIRLPKEINKGASYSWMPDKKHIVFGGESLYNRKTHLRLIGINDGTSKPLTAGYSAAENVPMVSPDGLRIAFSTLEGKGDLMEIPLDGSVLRHLSTDGFTPTWSPIGTQYAFGGENSGIYGIWLRSVSDHWTRPIVTTRELKAVTFDSPSFSPDGQRVAYQKDSGEIWLSPVSGGKPVRLLSQEWSADFPSWSPDGNWISFYDMRRKVLVKVGVTGTRMPVILKESISHFPPRWSPKGDWITYITSEGLSLISPDGKRSQLLAKGNWGVHAWSHDGRTIYGLKFEDQRVWLDSVELGTGVEKHLNELERASNIDYFGFSLSSDGSSVITSEVRSYATIWLLEDFTQSTSFFARLRQKLNLNP